MKNKFFALMFLAVALLSFCPSNHNNLAFADSVDTYYRIIGENVFLYKQPTLESTLENIYFKLPQSYFVKLISQQENVLYVEYDGICGYVSTNDLQQCFSTPSVPYALNLSLEIIEACNVVVYSTPSSTGEYVGLIPFNATNIKYYGSVNGQEVMPDQGSVWHFVRYQSFEQGVLFGYVYAPLTTNLSDVPTNTEEVQTTPDDIQQVSGSPVSAEFKSTDTVLVIVGLAVLALVLLYLLFKPDKRKKSAKRAQASVGRTDVKKLDYNAKHIENDEFDF